MVSSQVQVNMCALRFTSCFIAAHGYIFDHSDLSVKFVKLVKLVKLVKPCFVGLNWGSVREQLTDAHAFNVSCRPRAALVWNK